MTDAFSHEEQRTLLELCRGQRQRVETRSLPTLTRSYPRHFTFYVADPISSIQLNRRRHACHYSARVLMHRKPIMM
jgi:ABC-type hemin transport system ATPase subunit